MKGFLANAKDVLAGGKYYSERETRIFCRTLECQNAMKLVLLVNFRVS